MKPGLQKFFQGKCTQTVILAGFYFGSLIPMPLSQENTSDVDDADDDVFQA